MNEDHAAATANYISDRLGDPAFDVKSLVIHNSGFTDKSFAGILEILAK